MGDLVFLSKKQMDKLGLALRNAHYTNDEIDRLCEGNILVDIRGILNGKLEIQYYPHHARDLEIL